MLIGAVFVAVCLGFFVREVLRAPLIDSDPAPDGHAEPKANADSPEPKRSPQAGDPGPFALFAVVAVAALRTADGLF